MNLDHDSISGVSPSVARRIQELNRLPGIGPKSAQRLTYFIVRMAPDDARALAEAILAVKEKTLFCSICQNIADRDPCALCASDRRDRTQVCVVEEPLDVLALERARCYRGLYHVLHGVISPMNGVGPEDLKVRELLARLRDGGVSEVILATNPTLEGEATAMYIHRLLSPLGVKVTTLARGLPVGGDLENADNTTIARAFQGRREL